MREIITEADHEWADFRREYHRAITQCQCPITTTQAQILFWIVQDGIDGTRGELEKILQGREVDLWMLENEDRLRPLIDFYRKELKKNTPLNWFTDAKNIEPEQGDFVHIRRLPRMFRLLLDR